MTRIPVVLTGQALQSLRDSGYSLAAAMGEVIDNSLEAGANNVLIRMDEAPATSRSKKSHIHRIVFSDDGSGMDAHTLHHYLQIGYSTRYMRTDTIGKYGVGAKLAALNFGKRIDVWSRTDADAPWQYVYFDLDEALAEEQEGKGSSIGVDAPEAKSVPSDFDDILPKGTGTLVVWSKVDRLEEGRRAKDFNSLRLEAEKEISRIFRVFLNDGRNIEINGKSLLAHDPLFLMPDTWADQQLREYYRTGEGTRLGLKITEADYEAEEIAREPIKIGDHTAYLTVTLYPKAATRKRGLGGDELAKKLRIPENEGSISFMRMDREISYTNVPMIFGRRVDDPDRFIGIEVSFTPELDSYFGVRNVKRGFEPHDELRDKLRTALKRHVKTARDRLEERWGDVAKERRDHVGDHREITQAAAEAARTLPTPQAKTDIKPEEAYEELAIDVLGTDADEQTKANYTAQVKDLPFVVESVNFPGKQFMDVQHVGGKVIIRLNTRHRFYKEMWEPLSEISKMNTTAISPEQASKATRRAMEALTLLLIAYGRAESMHEDPHEQYEQLRDYWGIFLDSLMSKVKDVL
ncbi:histidine kinase [Planomonospora parontospora subsp. parontospora]|uniref:Histidine kinase n=2 Tax=Planomonospora parontospora TaxID=58119 RepID=A0AA37BGZ6_9ACTN|nr:ATP-binding protein [Planomonospora parontospora]GGK70008.1 histidine kinase [Planomonospora parontospora]GII09871.1 histidine kinase [Planomonospora parontospora subsp. parontospora]